jgi:alpha-tubulin suppressor-like RCC1 family protein
VAAGASHTVALKDDGTLWSWGDNSSGQLGDGTTTGRSSAVQVSGLIGAISIAAGGKETFAVRGDGVVVAWGENGSGQLGDGTTTNRSTPVVVSGVATIDTESPNAPTNVQVVYTGPTSMAVTWDAATDNVGVTSSEVFRDGSSVGKTTSRSMNLRGSASTAYTITICAYDGLENRSEPSTPVTATMTAHPKVGAGGSHGLALKTMGRCGRGVRTIIASLAMGRRRSTPRRYK